MVCPIGLAFSNLMLETDLLSLVIVQLGVAKRVSLEKVEYPRHTADNPEKISPKTKNTLSIPHHYIITIFNYCKNNMKKSHNHVTLINFLFNYLAELHTYLSMESKEENILIISGAISRAHNVFYNVKQELYARNTVKLQRRFS